MTPSLFPPWGGRALHPSPEAASLAGMGEAQSTARRRGGKGKGKKTGGTGASCYLGPSEEPVKVSVGLGVLWLGNGVRPPWTPEVGIVAIVECHPQHYGSSSLSSFRLSLLTHLCCLPSHILSRGPSFSIYSHSDLKGASLALSKGRGIMKCGHLT